MNFFLGKKKNTPHNKISKSKIKYLINWKEWACSVESPLG